MPAIKTDTKPPAKPDAQPDGGTDRGSLGVAAHDPLGRPQEHADRAGDRRKQQQARPLQSRCCSRLSSKNGSRISQPTKRPQPAGQTQIEIARVEDPDDKRLRLHFGQRSVEHGLLVEKGLDLGRKQVGGVRPQRFLRARRRHEPYPSVSASVVSGDRN